MASEILNTPAGTEDQPPHLDGNRGGTSFSLAHLSDPHISCMQGVNARDLLNKRLFGYLRWKLHRSAEHGEGVLSALKADLKQTKPDHLAVTGDLTHLGLPAEFQKARQWLQSLGSPSEVTVIPGNHDAYVKIDWQYTMAHWTEYMLSDAPRQDDPLLKNPPHIFPGLRTRGPVALISVNTARPSAPHLAVGTIGAAQLQSLSAILDRTARKGFYRILLIHHPPAPGAVSWRKRLTDAAELRFLLDQYGAELLLHGHAHRELRNYLSTPAVNIPVMGAPSISALGRTHERRARYYIYRMARRCGHWDVGLEVRIWSPEENRFVRESEQILVKAGKA